MFRTTVALTAALTLLPTLAHAEVARWGQAIYPDRVSAPPPVAALPAPSTLAEPVPVARGRGRYAGRGRHRRQMEALATSPIETQPAPTPVDDKAKAAPPAQSSGPHEQAAPTIYDLVSRHARESGVPEKLASAVVGIESRFNPNARGGSAMGLMQIQVATARANGFAGSARSLLEPETNLHYGMKVLADAYRASRGDICMTLAKYQSGHLTTRISASNRAYCAKARALMAKA